MGSILDKVTTEQFKTLFKRDFVFLPVYVEGHIYFKDDIIYYDTNFYKSLSDNNAMLPSDSTAWQVVNIDESAYISDDDILKAMSQARIAFNVRFGSTEEETINIFLHLVAFYLMMDLKNATSSTGATGILTSTTVGNVSESYALPTFVQNNPLYSIYMQNGYGLKYLSLILPYLSSRILFSRGGTTFG